MTLIEFIDRMYIESNRTISRKDTGEVVEYKNLKNTERNPWRYAVMNQIEERLELLFDLPGFVPGLPSEQMMDFQVRTTIPYEEARMRLKLIHDEISAAYRSAKKNIVFSKWAEDSFEGMKPYEKIVGFRDIFFRKYAYDLADSGLITVLYDNDFLKEISDWLDTAAYIIFGDNNSLVWKYVHDGEVFKPRITKKMCDTLCREDESYLIWHNILMSILSMYNDKIAELHASEYEYSLPLSKRLQSMTGSDERFIRSLLTCITDHAEYEGKSIRTFKKLKQGYWECLPLQNRMELYNRIEALIENQNLHKYMLIDSYKDAAQRVLRLYNKLLEPGYYRICLKMDMMMNGIYGNQCKSSEEAGEAIREYERRINEVYDYFLENVELSANQIEKNVTAQLDAAFSAKDNAEAISEKASPVLPAVLDGENLTTQFEAILSGKYSDELFDDHVEENRTVRLDTADKQMKQPDN